MKPSREVELFEILAWKVTLVRLSTNRYFLVDGYWLVEGVLLPEGYWEYGRRWSLPEVRIKLFRDELPPEA